MAWWNWSGSWYGRPYDDWITNYLISNDTLPAILTAWLHTAWETLSDSAEEMDPLSTNDAFEVLPDTTHFPAWVQKFWMTTNVPSTWHIRLPVPLWFQVDKITTINSDWAIIAPYIGSWNTVDRRSLKCYGEKVKLIRTVKEDTDFISSVSKQAFEEKEKQIENGMRDDVRFQMEKQASIFPFLTDILAIVDTPWLTSLEKFEKINQIFDANFVYNISPAVWAYYTVWDGVDFFTTMIDQPSATIWSKNALQWVCSTTPNFWLAISSLFEDLVLISVGTDANPIYAMKWWNKAHAVILAIDKTGSFVIRDITPRVATISWNNNTHTDVKFRNPKYNFRQQNISWESTSENETSNAQSEGLSWENIDNASTNIVESKKSNLWKGIDRIKDFNNLSLSKKEQDLFWLFLFDLPEVWYSLKPLSNDMQQNFEKNFDQKRVNDTTFFYQDSVSILPKQQELLYKLYTTVSKIDPSLYKILSQPVSPEERKRVLNSYTIGEATISPNEINQTLWLFGDEVTMRILFDERDKKFNKKKLNENNKKLSCEIFPTQKNILVPDPSIKTNLTFSFPLCNNEDKLWSVDLSLWWSWSKWSALALWDAIPVNFSHVGLRFLYLSFTKRNLLPSSLLSVSPTNEIQTDITIRYPVITQDFFQQANKAYKVGLENPTILPNGSKNNQVPDNIFFSNDGVYTNRLFWAEDLESYFKKAQNYSKNNLGDHGLVELSLEYWYSTNTIYKKIICTVSDLPAIWKQLSDSFSENVRSLKLTTSIASIKYWDIDQNIFVSWVQQDDYWKYFEGLIAPNIHIQNPEIYLPDPTTIHVARTVPAEIKKYLESTPNLSNPLFVVSPFTFDTFATEEIPFLHFVFGEGQKEILLPEGQSVESWWYKFYHDAMVLIEKTQDGKFMIRAKILRAK